MYGGDDYQLAFTAPARHREAILELADQHSVRVSRAGAVTRGTGTSLPDGAWPDGGFTHFDSVSRP